VNVCGRSAPQMLASTCYSVRARCSSAVATLMMHVLVMAMLAALHDAMRLKQHHRHAVTIPTSHVAMDNAGKACEQEVQRNTLHLSNRLKGRQGIGQVWKTCLDARRNPMCAALALQVAALSNTNAARHKHSQQASCAWTHSTRAAKRWKQKA
jgi:hypothetical protein